MHAYKDGGLVNDRLPSSPHGPDPSRHLWNGTKATFHDLPRVEWANTMIPMKHLLLPCLILLAVPAEAQLNLGLKGHWTFAGGSAIDLSGQTNDGTVMGGVTQTVDRAGSPGCALQFPGNTSHVTIPFSSDFDQGPADAFSISLWYQGGSSNGTDQEWLFAKRQVGASWVDTDYGLVLYDLNQVLGSLGPNGEVWSNVLPPVPDPQWHHVVYIYDNGTQQLWLDNMLVNSSTQPVFVGQSSEGIVIGEQFLGAIDDVRYYDRAVSNTDVALLFQETANCATSTGMAERDALAIIVAPNPATDRLTVHLPEARGSLELLDATGRSVQRVDVTNTTTLLQVAHLPDGLYLLSYSNGPATAVQRITVK